MTPSQGFGNSYRSRAVLIPLILLMIATALLSPPRSTDTAFATSTGDLDLSFDSDGWATISGSGLWFEAASVVVQSSGKVVVAGARMNGFQFDPLIARFNTDGSLDTSFGSDGTGVVVEPWPDGETIMEWVNRSGAAVDVALLSDDRIVLTSSPSGDDEKHGIMLFTADGVLDTTFDGDGRRKITSGGPAMDVWTTAVTVTSDDKIMIVGTSPDNGWDYRMKVYRLNTDGTNDALFNNDGMRNVYFPSSVDNLANAVVMSGEKTVFGGSAAASWQRHDMGIGQLTSDGRNDTAFASGDGRTYVDFGFGDSDVRELLVQADGKIVAIGESQVFDNDDSVAVTRLNTDGSLDTSFSDDGKFAYDFGTGDSYGWAGAIDGDGRIVVAGQYNNGVNDKAFVMRLTSAGELDTTFGTGGVRTYDFAGDNAESFNAIAVQGDDMVVAGGSGSDLLVARLTDLYSNTLNITYDSQGGSDVTDGDATTTAGGSIATLPSDPTRTGYTFNGWYTATSGGTQITAGTAHNQTADFTLYAQWTADPVYTVTFNANGGTGAPSAVECWSGSVTLPSTAPTRSGYSFAGWSTAVNGSDTASSAVTGITMEGPSNNQSGTVAALPQTGGWVSLNETLSPGQRLVMNKDFFDDIFQEFPHQSEFDIGIKDPVNWSNTASIFSGAFVNDHFIRIVKYASGNTIARHYTGSSYTGLTDVVLTWTDYEAFFELTADGNNIRYGQRYGTASGTNPTYSHDIDTTQYPDWDSNNKTETGDQGYGYTTVDVVIRMSGNTHGQEWDTANIDWTGLELAASPGASVSCTDVTLYAQWTADTLNITYDSQGGSTVTDGDATTTTGGAIATLPTNPTRSGYTFTGWYTATSGGTQISAGDDHGQTGDFTLYAQWQAVPTTTTTTTPPTTTTTSTTTTTVAPTTTTVATTSTTTTEVQTSTTSSTAVTTTSITETAEPPTDSVELPATGTSPSTLPSVPLIAIGCALLLVSRLPKKS